MEQVTQPPPPPATENVHTRTLHAAVRVLGDEQVLAVFLGVPWARLNSWMLGHEPTPMHAFLAAVDIITADNRVLRARLKAITDRARVDQGRPSLQQVKRA
jgi:DNA-binding transcriptional regulator YdaS (Cro superfamily)